MLQLSEVEKKLLSDGAYSTYGVLYRKILEDAIHRTQLQHLQTPATETLKIQALQSTWMALEDAAKMPLELSK